MNTVSKVTDQLKLWSGDFGYEYSARNQMNDYNFSRLRRNWGQMLARCLSPAPTEALEVGANIGINLVALKELIPKLHAVEPNQKCCQAMLNNNMLSDVVINNGDAFSLPYNDASIDLVFTSGVLIHVAPADLQFATDEIIRVSRHYVLCIEYFSPNPVTIPYRDIGENFLFKRDFGSWYLDNYPGLKIVDYGFLWKRVDSGDNVNWWMFRK